MSYFNMSRNTEVVVICHFGFSLETMAAYTMISNHGYRNIELLLKLLFSFSILIFNTVKLLVMFFIIKQFAQINVFKKEKLLII